MSEFPEQQPLPDTTPRSSPRPENSVIRFLEAKTGNAPRVSLLDEDSASVSAPVIDPSSREKLAVPQGRGSYQLMGEIARGGMGVVLKGHDTDLGRDIALKVLDKRLCERMDVVQRFVEEAQIGGQLQHPGIVPVYELGMMADERPYFTMKLVKGKTLAALLAARETSSSDRGRLIDIFESVCQTMAYAHSRGVIHRDLKPANIMVGAFGEVQVVDWGLAKVLLRGGTADEKRARELHETRTILETVRSDGSGSGTQSMVGSVLGTPAYMPPEQASGQVQRLDERSDVFALGAILCEILTGLPPYVGEPAEIIEAASQAELDGALERLDACQTEEVLVKLTKQCLMPAPAARPADASVLAARIQEYVVSKEERAHRAEVEAAEAAARVQEERKARHLTLALGAAVVAIVLVGSGGWLWVQNERAAQERSETARLQQAAERDQALQSQVNAALNEAALLEGGERWDEAIVAADRARAVAEAGGASEELLGTVNATLTKLNAALAEARSREELRRDTQQLVAELRQVSREDQPVGPEELERQYRATFAAHGIDLDAGELEEAAAQLTRRDSGPELALALDEWGEARRLVEDEEGALRLLDIAHIVDPDPDRAHLREALAMRDLAELRYLASEGFTGQPASTYILLALALQRLEDRDLAFDVLRMGLDEHPDDFQLHYTLGSELTPDQAGTGEPEELREAEVHLRAAIALEPESAFAHFYVGRVRDRLGDKEGAVEHLERAIEHSPDRLEFWHRKADLLRDLRRDDEAIAIFERVATAEGATWEDGWAYSNLAGFAARAGDHERALELARKALASRDSYRAFIRVWMYAPFVVVTGQSGDEAALLEARRELDAEFTGATADEYARLYEGFARVLLTGAYPLGYRWRDKGFSPEGRELVMKHALELVQAGLENGPDRPILWMQLGFIHYFQNDPAGAVQALTRSLELARDNLAITPIRWFWLARAHHAAGDEDEARAWYDRALAWMAVHPKESDDDNLRWNQADTAQILGLE